MNKKEIQKRVSDLNEQGEWNCYFEFPYGIKTRKNHINSPGYNLNKWPRLLKILNKINIEKKSIIDIGCGDGYYAIQCALNGASKVLGTDIDELRIKRGLLAKELLNVPNVDFKTVSLYEDKIENFDILLGLGLLHRVPDLDGCMEVISNICTTAILEFKTLNKPESTYEYKGGKSKSNKYNGLYYIPTQSYVINKMKDLGFKNHKIFNDNNSNLNYKRSIIAFFK